MKYFAYPKYKSSGVEWLGDVPDHWEVKAIKWETPVFRGASPRPIDDPVYFNDEGEYAWVRIADVTASHIYLEETTQRLSDIGASLSVKLNPGKLFLSIAATVGVPCITKIKCCIHDGFVHFPRLKSDTKFMYYIFDCGEPYKGLGKLGTQLNLNTDTVGSIVMGFPPLLEQKAIAEFLDNETRRIDSLIGKKQRFIELLKEKRTALISRAVTKGLNLKVKMKQSGVEWLGDVPEHWVVKRLKHLVKKIIDNRGRTPEFGDEGIPMLEVRQITEGLRYPTDTFEKFVEETIVAQFERDKVNKGDILISTVGATSGKAVMVDKQPNYFIAQNVIGIRAMNYVDNAYLYYSIISEYFVNSLFSINKANTIDNLKVSVFVNNYCLLPPLPEQQAIAAFLDRETSKIDTLVAKVGTAIEKLKEYRTALISAAVTGKIDVSTGLNTSVGEVA
jgi:type I restriction enzyme S subunit